jgi:hypothetical protein
MKSGGLNLLEPSGPLQTCTGIVLSLTLPYRFYGKNMEFGVPLISYPMDTAVFSPVFKRLERKGEHSLSPSVDVSNARRLISMLSAHLRGSTARYRHDLILTFFNYSFKGNYGHLLNVSLLAPSSQVTRFNYTLDSAR